MDDRSSPPQLVRAVGLFSLTAIAINGIVGSGIFVLPATAAKLLGPLSPLAYLTSGLAAVLIVLCFAEVGSRFESSGGPYAYARAAFGSFVGFEVGWMFVVARMTAVAAIANASTAYLSYFWPAVAVGPGRILAISLSLLALTAVNLYDVRYGAWMVNLLTVGKLLPLLLLATVGLFFLDARQLTPTSLPQIGPLRQASLVLLFAFGGFEYASVPAGEVINPRRHLPTALIAAVTLTTILYVLIQLVALGTVPQLSNASAPLTSAAEQVFGVGGAAIVTAGAVLSTTGTNSGAVLVGSRALYAMAEGHQLPAVLGRVHPRYRTPHVSVIVFAMGAWALAMHSNFLQLATVSAIARLVTYLTTCLAVPILRRKMSNASRQFKLPGGPLIPFMAAAICLWLLTGSTSDQAVVGAAALVLGAVIFLLMWSKALRLVAERLSMRSRT
jgi:amino acid transporter